MSEFDIFWMCFPDSSHLRAPEPDNNQESRGSNENTWNNIGQGANQDDIAELRQQGVEVENEDCLPENLPSGENKIIYWGCMGNG